MMSEEDKRKFEDNRPELMQNIDLGDGIVFAHLRKRKRLTADQEDAIKQEPGGSSRKVGKLLDIQLKGDRGTLDDFRASLVASSPAHKALAETCFGAATSTDCPTVPPLHLATPEYEHARRLAKDEKERNRFLETLSRKSRRITPRVSLLEVVRQLGFKEKLLVYLVQLVPEVCEQIGPLFVITRVQITKELELTLDKYFDFQYYKPFHFQYYKELFDACRDETSKNTLIRALVDAEVVAHDSTSSHENEMTWFGLLQQLNSKDCAALLNKTHSLQLCVKGEQQSTISPKEDILMANEFVLAVVSLYDCAIVADRVVIYDLDLPVCMLTRNISSVKRLLLMKCELQEAVPGYMATSDTSALLEHQTPTREDCSLEEVEVDFHEVKGMTILGHCQGTITSRPCRLHLTDCDDVKAIDLKNCFPNICELHLDNKTTVLHPEAACNEGFSSRAEGGTPDTPMSFIDKIAQIGPICRFFSQSLHLMKIVREQTLQIKSIATANNTMVHCITVQSGSVSLGQFLDACSPCLQCKSLTAQDCTIDFDIGNTRYGLCKLQLSDPQYPLDIAKLLVFCSRCLQMQRVEVKCYSLPVDEKTIFSVPQIPGKVTFIFQNYYIVSKPTGTPFEKDSGQDMMRKCLIRVCPLAEVEFKNWFA